ncbi:carboxypeptidase-like regulatory domain-containing protein [Segatella bryantii]|uniref:carboxypeptidase-like regulatory domain-containing protein n=1 Tax=Segatella bryantii TaxID=77095 RepID=UPI00243024EE|nr:carboxypeptidase-like regulatory domain-containing protein [Segatella bryantii]
MKHLKYILASLTTIISMLAEAQGNITGRVIDEQSQPIPFVNVVLLNRADSAFIMGTVTKDDGTFTIETDRYDRLLKVSSLGYQPEYIQARRGNVGDIQLLPDSQTLGEVVVKGHVPSYRMTTEGIQTNVENTVLSKLGTGEDVLAHVPGITKKDDAFEVFGKGAPLIYINGRLMRDASELDQLKSENIKSVARHYNLALGQSL